MKGVRMVTDEFIDSLEIDKDKADTLKCALKKDSFYRNLLYKAGVFPCAIEPIMKMTDTSAIDESQAELLREKIMVEWRDYIPVDKRK